MTSPGLPVGTGGHGSRLGPLGFVVAALLAVPVGAVGWFEIVYLYFGLTGNDPPGSFSAAAAFLAFGLALGWPLYGARRVAEVVRRACRLGLVVAILLPVVTVAVLLLWQSATNRPDLGMGGLVLYNLPFIGMGLGAVLAVLFILAGRSAARRL